MAKIAIIKMIDMTFCLELMLEKTQKDMYLARFALSEAK